MSPPEATPLADGTGTPGHSHDSSKEISTKLKAGKSGDGKERRIEILYNDPLPYRWICKIKIFAEVANDPVTLGDRCPCNKCKRAREPSERRTKGNQYVRTKTDQTKIRYGTGFLVNIPHSTRCIIFTAAHNLTFEAKDSDFRGKSTVEDDESDTSENTNTLAHIVSVARLIVTFPGREPIEVKKNEFWFPPKYTCRHIDEWTRSNYDYGVIVLPGLKQREQACGFGFSATLTDRELLGVSLNIFGYPVLDETQPEQESGSTTLDTRDDRVLYGSGGDVQSVGPRIIRYFVNTSEGQSGCPVYLWDKGYYTAVGIHAQYEKLGEFTINAASRIRVGMLQNIFAWLHKYDVDVFRKETNSNEFWFPFWHVALYSQGDPDSQPEVADEKTHGTHSPRILCIPGAAPRDPRENTVVEYQHLYTAPEWIKTKAELKAKREELRKQKLTSDERKERRLELEKLQEKEVNEAVAKFSRAHPGSQVGIIPVKTFSEGHAAEFQDNLWVICSRNHEDTFVTFNANSETPMQRISVSSRYRHTPILPRALELVQMVSHKENPDSSPQWSISPLRCPTVINKPSGNQDLDKHLGAFYFRYVTILKVGDHTAPAVVEVPGAETSLPLFLAVGAGLIGYELLKAYFGDKDEQPEGSTNKGELLLEENKEGKNTNTAEGNVNE